MSSFCSLPYELGKEQKRFMAVLSAQNFCAILWYLCRGKAAPLEHLELLEHLAILFVPRADDKGKGKTQ